MLELLAQVRFRTVRPTDIPVCFSIEKSSYPRDEAASKSDLQYRQHHAARYFRCAVTGKEDEDEVVIGFICATRCHEFNAESMSSHYSNGPLLAIHSVVTDEKYRGKGVATAMIKDYVEVMQGMKDDGVQKIVLLAKAELLSFYVNNGFSVIRRSAIQHGSDAWYELQLDLSLHKKSGVPYYIVDSFAKVDSLGSGNPAAVVKMKPGTDPSNPETWDWMLVVAKEFNLAETAFIWPHEEEKQGREIHWYIRFFSPKLEIPLCGHATLAAAGVLYQTLSIKNKIETPVVFHAKENILHTELSSGGNRSRNGRTASNVVMKFPCKPASEITSEEGKLGVENMIFRALKLTSDCILYKGISDTGDVLVEVTPEAFSRIGYENLNYNALLEWDGYSRGVIICCLAPHENNNSNSDQHPINFYSRFFGPKAGINEDPVTGSAHCALAPYFSAKLGKDRVTGKQQSERGGIVECQVEEKSVKITGTTVKTMSGSLFL